VADGGQIGVVWVSNDEAWLATHDLRPVAPKGTGDLLAAVFVAALIGGQAPQDALAIAAGAVAEGVATAEAAGLDELPLSAMPTGLGVSQRISLRRLDG
jgi:pyridoxine kinase